MSNGKAPDIGIMHDDTLATNAARQVVQPLDDVATALKLTEEDFAEIAWNGGVYKDKRYGIPLDMHPAGLYYNQTVLEKVGADPEKPPTNERRADGDPGQVQVQGSPGHVDLGGQRQ